MISDTTSIDTPHDAPIHNTVGMQFEKENGNWIDRQEQWHFENLAIPSSSEMTFEALHRSILEKIGQTVSSQLLDEFSSLHHEQRESRWKELSIRTESIITEKGLVKSLSSRYHELQMNIVNADATYNIDEIKKLPVQDECIIDTAAIVTQYLRQDIINMDRLLRLNGRIETHKPVNALFTKLPNFWYSDKIYSTQREFDIFDSIDTIEEDSDTQTRHSQLETETEVFEKDLDLDFHPVLSEFSSNNLILTGKADEGEVCEIDRPADDHHHIRKSETSEFNDTIANNRTTRLDESSIEVIHEANIPTVDDKSMVPQHPLPTRNNPERLFLDEESARVSKFSCAESITPLSKRRRNAEPFAQQQLQQQSIRIESHNTPISITTDSLETLKDIISREDDSLDNFMRMAGGFTQQNLISHSNDDSLTQLENLVQRKSKKAKTHNINLPSTANVSSKQIRLIEQIGTRSTLLILPDVFPIFSITTLLMYNILTKETSDKNTILWISDTEQDLQYSATYHTCFLKDMINFQHHVITQNNLSSTIMTLVQQNKEQKTDTIKSNLIFCTPEAIDVILQRDKSLLEYCSTMIFFDPILSDEQRRTRCNRLIHNIFNVTKINLQAIVVCHVAPAESSHLIDFMKHAQLRQLIAKTSMDNDIATNVHRDHIPIDIKNTPFGKFAQYLTRAGNFVLGEIIGIESDLLGSLFVPDSQFEELNTRELRFVLREAMGKLRIALEDHRNRRIELNEAMMRTMRLAVRKIVLVVILKGSYDALLDGGTTAVLNVIQHADNDALYRTVLQDSLAGIKCELKKAERHHRDFRDSLNEYELPADRYPHPKLKSFQDIARSLIEPRIDAFVASEENKGLKAVSILVLIENGSIVPELVHTIRNILDTFGMRVFYLDFTEGDIGENDDDKGKTSSSNSSEHAVYEYHSIDTVEGEFVPLQPPLTDLSSIIDDEQLSYFLLLKASDLKKASPIVAFSKLTAIIEYSNIAMSSDPLTLEEQEQSPMMEAVAKNGVTLFRFNVIDSSVPQTIVKSGLCAVLPMTELANTWTSRLRHIITQHESTSPRSNILDPMEALPFDELRNKLLGPTTHNTNVMFLDPVHIDFVKEWLLRMKDVSADVTTPHANGPAPPSIIITESVIPNREFVEGIEARWDIRVVERGAPVFSPADIIISPTTCVLFISPPVDYDGSNHGLLDELAVNTSEKIMMLYQQFTKCIVIAEQYETKDETEFTELGSSIVQVIQDIRRFVSDMHDFQLETLYSFSVDQTVDIVATNFSVENRNMPVWIGEEQSPECTVLCMFPCINLLSAELLLNGLSLEDLVDQPLELLKKKFDTLIPERFLHHFHNLCHSSMEMIVNDDVIAYHETVELPVPQDYDHDISGNLSYSEEHHVPDDIQQPHWIHHTTNSAHTAQDEYLNEAGYLAHQTTHVDSQIESYEDITSSRQHSHQHSHGDAHYLDDQQMVYPNYSTANDQRSEFWDHRNMRDMLHDNDNDMRPYKRPRLQGYEYEQNMFHRVHHHQDVIQHQSTPEMDSLSYQERQYITAQQYALPSQPTFDFASSLRMDFGSRKSNDHQDNHHFARYVGPSTHEPYYIQESSNNDNLGNVMHSFGHSLPSVGDDVIVTYSPERFDFPSSRQVNQHVSIAPRTPYQPRDEQERFGQNQYTPQRGTETTLLSTDESSFVGDSVEMTRTDPPQNRHRFMNIDKLQNPLENETGRFMSPILSPGNLSTHLRNASKTPSSDTAAVTEARRKFDALLHRCTPDMTATSNSRARTKKVKPAVNRTRMIAGRKSRYDIGDSSMKTTRTTRDGHSSGDGTTMKRAPRRSKW